MFRRALPQGWNGLIDFLLVNTATTQLRISSGATHRCEQYEVRDQAPAAGEWRGGVSVVRRNRFLVDGFVSSEGDRQKDVPKGVYGGHNGTSAAFVLNPGTANETALPGKLTGFRCREGDVIEIRSATGGGWGSPLDRDPWAVWRDVEDGYASEGDAAATYAVVLDPAGPNLSATKSLREERRRISQAREDGATSLTLHNSKGPDVQGKRSTRKGAKRKPKGG